MALPFDRPANGYRFAFAGMKVNCAPDACPPNKYPLVLNGRAFSDDEMCCRPGMQLLFATGTSQPISNIASYSQGQGNIRYLAASNGNIYKDDSATPIDTSFSASAIQSMVPYRPNQSPAPFVYVGDSSSYKKFSFPNGSDVVSVSKVGVAEPQAPVDASLTGGFVSGIGQPWLNPTFAPGGTAGTVTIGSRISDTIVDIFPDPAISAIQYTQVGTVGYQRNMLAILGGADVEILDVYQPCSTPFGIAGIYYYAGTTGKCVIVPQNVGQGPGNENQSLFIQQAIVSLRRGSIIQFSTGETCLVLTVSIGLNGQVSFETTTSGTHTTSETLTIKPSVATYNAGSSGAITSPCYSFQVASGIGTVTLSGLSGSYLVQSLQLFQAQDYLHFSINIDNLSNLAEMKLLIDVGDGSFTENFYFYAVRPSDIQAGVANTLTQLGVAQLYSQRQAIEEEDQAQGVAASTPTPPGSTQWAEILVPIAELIRVGNDQTKTLLNINAVQFLFNATGTINVLANSVSFRGGYQVDIGDTGAPCRYRIRPRSTATGVKGNPSPDMRYGVSPRRDQVTVILPGSAYDPQFNVWDIFRLGGVLTAWTFVGTCPVGITSFIDIYDDTTIANSQQLDFDNLEPWPSIDVPLNGTCSVVGTAAVVTPAAGSSTLIANYLPGNKVQVNQQVFTLWNRPVNLGSTWLFQFQENAGVYAAGSALSVYEPAVANQQSRMTWGPTDDGGVVFGLDPLRPGTVSFCKNFNPDSVPDNYNLELCPPSEPLMGGCYARGLCAVGSSARKWLLRPSFGQANQWTPTPLPGGGLASPFGMATDGETVFAIEKNGITANGVSITTEDLSNIFPIDGVPPLNNSVEGVFSPPDFTKANLFRLSCTGGYLYFNYIDLNGLKANTLAYDIKRKGWSYDNPTGVVLHVPVIQAQSQASGVSGSTNPVQLLMGDLLGNVFEEVDGIADNTAEITFRVITSEYTGGEARALAQWGDVYASILPGLNIQTTVKCRSGGADVMGATTLVPLGTTRIPVIVNAGNPILFSMGLDITCVQTFAGGETAATLYIWQPAMIPQPVVEQMRAWDWDNAGVAGNKFWQGFILEANTNGNQKALGVRDADALALHPFTPSPVNFASQSEQAFSFTTPFIAHSVRLEPQDAVNWNGWGIRWVTRPFPESCETWQTELLSLGMIGWAHARELNVPYISTDVVTLTLTFDSASVGGPIVLTLPSSAGLQLKTRITPTFNKWKLIGFKATSPSPFALFLEDFEVKIRAWGSDTPYQIIRPFGGQTMIGAEV